MNFLIFVALLLKNVKNIYKQYSINNKRLAENSVILYHLSKACYVESKNEKKMVKHRMKMKTNIYCCEIINVNTDFGMNIIIELPQCGVGCQSEIYTRRISEILILKKVIKAQ